MNYLKEINAFHNMQETNPLSTAAAHLWSVLMHVNNRAGWKKEFSVAASLLCVKAALKEGTFKRARLELRDKGYIRFTPQGANRAAVYEMISLVHFEDNAGVDAAREDGGGERAAADGENIVLGEHVRTGDGCAAGAVEGGALSGESAGVAGRMDHSTDRSADPGNGGSVAPLYKQNKAKQKEHPNTTPGVSDAVVFYQENFGVIRPYVAEDLLNWVKDVGELLVLAAMKRALERGKGSWGYVKAILKDWQGRGVRTVADVHAADVAFQNQKHERKRSRRSFGSKREEVIPDWFKERKKKLALEEGQEVERKQNPGPERVRGKEAEEAEKKELEALVRG
ncbi:DnaD domain-containing protein [Virgibacillus alimentarius]|uniref:DnaD/phage-associated family protein n=1 Tax=Virgibacillus alimentarius TaxID=698769 RepID=A0ABS4SB89_9BACI|nr:DnaD domain protein [Virgibacillus alimentarius]MBP2258779.1 DnaD/phage-associated family protein [Virgibacillus alimentarius]